ncbi:MAG: FAD-dependent oxidoreductase, partial [Leptolyngbyaceae cyanobacterium bins.59]|nr:FAD-dependent oxidoreductase [Leptolyngbyaceae cyanobacterium bins.59]
MNSYEIAVIGAGMAGLTCAQQLQQMGYQVVVLDKSRGVGGRIATRRVGAHVVDHGARYLEPQGPLTERLIQILVEQQKLHLWSDRMAVLPADQSLQSLPKGSTSPGLPRYVAPSGMTTIPKFLATGLTLYLGQWVKGLTLTPERTWQLQLESNQPDCPETFTHLEARSLVIAIPAPQALALLSPLPDRVFPAESLNLLQSITYDPCLSIMAGYPDDRLQALESAELDWRAIDCPGDSHLQWIGWDHAKRSQAKAPISSPIS